MTPLSSGASRVLMPCAAAGDLAASMNNSERQTPGVALIRPAAGIHLKKHLVEISECALSNNVYFLHDAPLK
jgi:hypothetical protein